MTDLAPITLEALRVRICRVLPGQIRAAVEKLSDKEIWWRPNEKSNSIGNLILHVSGSLNLFLNSNIGRIPYQRDRDLEFSERRPLAKTELMKIFDDMVAKAEQTLARLPADRLAGPSSDPERQDYLVEDLVGIATHLSTHTGQILWIAKSLHEGEFNEVWMKTHKHFGGWKKKP